MSWEEGLSLARVTTIGTGGPARAYTEPRTLAELECTLRAAREQGLAVATVGLGSNVLAADEGVDMLVLRLRGELAEARAHETILAAGGGATNAVCLHRARAAGLGGFEFACAIPGTAGGGVWMNAGAYDSDWSADPRPGARRDGGRHRLADAGRARALLPALEPAARPGRRRGRVPALSARPGRDPSRGPGSRRAAQGDAADDEANVRLGVQEPAGRDRSRADARALRAEGLPPRGSRDLAEARELHRERGRRDERPTVSH